MSNFPIVHARIGFQSNPADNPQIWRDVYDSTAGTSLIRSGATRRGRQSELDQIQPGSAEVVFSNDDRRFDPTYSGPYNPYVIPMRRIELRVLPESYYDAIMDSSPSAYWPLSETTGTSGSVDDVSANNNDGTVTGTIRGSAGPLVYESGRTTAYDFNAAGQASVTVPQLSTTLGQYTTVSFWMYWRGSALNSMPIGFTNYNLFAGKSGTNSFGFNTANGEVWGVSGSGLTGAWKHVVAVFYNGNPQGAASLYIDGVLQTLSFQLGAACVSRSVTTSFKVSGWNSSAAFYFDGLMAHVAVFNRAATAAEVRAWYAAGMGKPIFNGFVESWPQSWPGQADAIASLSAADLMKAINMRQITAGAWPITRVSERTDQRVGWILDQISWPSAFRTFDTGVVSVQALSASEPFSASEHLQATVDTESGTFFIDPDGYAIFKNRNNRGGETTSSYTFGDGGGSELPYSDIVLSYDDTRIYNDVTVTRVGGTPQNATDATSQTAYFPRSLVLSDTLHTSDADALATAQYLRNIYKQPRQRIASLVLNPLRDERLWDAVLSLELGDRVTVIRRPSGAVVPISQEVIVEAIEHRFAPRQWQTILQLSPAGVSAEWTVGVSELGIDTYLAF